MKTHPGFLKKKKRGTRNLHATDPTSCCQFNIPRCTTRKVRVTRGGDVRVRNITHDMFDRQATRRLEARPTTHRGTRTTHAMTQAGRVFSRQLVRLSTERANRTTVKSRLYGKHTRAYMSIRFRGRNDVHACVASTPRPDRARDSLRPQRHLRWSCIFERRETQQSTRDGI
jgi:hypothetical protein